MFLRQGNNEDKDETEVLSPADGFKNVNDWKEEGGERVNTSWVIMRYTDREDVSSYRTMVFLYIKQRQRYKFFYIIKLNYEKNPA